MGKSLDMNYVNCALLVVVLVISVICLTKINSPKACVPVEHFGRFRNFFRRVVSQTPVAKLVKIIKDKPTWSETKRDLTFVDAAENPYVKIVQNNPWAALV